MKGGDHRLMIDSPMDVEWRNRIGDQSILDIRPRLFIPKRLPAGKRAYSKDLIELGQTYPFSMAYLISSAVFLRFSLSIIFAR